MRVPRRWAFVVGAVAFCLCCLFLQVLIEMGIGSRKEPNLVSSENDPMGKPMLGLVVPLSAEDITWAVQSIKRWPRTCSGNIVNRVDLVLYFAGELPLELERHLTVASDPMSCFKRTRVVSAALRPEEKSVQDVRSAQFYNLFLVPDVRAYFVDYDAIAIMDWDTIIAQETTFERLYRTAFEGSEPFWVKGSRLGGTYSDDGAALDMWHRLDNLDSNAIYNNTDQDFLDFVKFTLDQWQFTRPSWLTPTGTRYFCDFRSVREKMLIFRYDVALWATISDYPYSWPLWQRYASKFVTTSMLSAVGVEDVEDEVVTKGVGPDTLFLRRRSKSTGKRSDIVEEQFRECYQACGSHESLVGHGVVSTVCDATCVSGHPWMGIRFDGHNCGAGDPSRYGRACRLCFKDQQAALDTDQALNALSGNSWASHDHVIMCDTKRPPEAIDCRRECTDNINTICDSRCGSGIYDNWYCDWRGLGEKCRFCFNDITAARRADKIAKENRGRVVMCETHEPPPEGQDMDRIAGIRLIIHDDVELGVIESAPVDNANSRVAYPGRNQAAIPFIGGITHGNICIFIPGYIEFFHETRLAVASIETFMPGVRVVIATHPVEYHAFHRALGELNTAVSIVNDTRVAYASLAADTACGNDTRLIYYIGPGEILSRPFTAKDTHSPEGDLLVKQTTAELAGGEHARRSMGTTTLLGFHGLSLTYGSDLILPAAINAQLREKMRTAIDESGLNTSGDRNGDENIGTSAFHEFLDSMSSDHSKYASIFIPELLAAQLFSQNPVGVQFIDPRDQRHHFSAEATIWQIPLVKPRFGCSMDLSLTLQGYNVAQQLGDHLEAFRNGARCDRGFIAVDPTALKLKAEWEFPAGFPTSRMPSLRDFRISVMYRTFSGDAELFKISLPTAIKHIPDALEIVVVVEEVDGDLFEQLLAPHRESAPFPLRVVTEPSIMNGHIQQKYSKIRADLYTKGDYVLHLDSDVFVLREVTYDDIFHLGKPVLPYRRYRDDTPEGVGLISCWQNGTSFGIGEEVVHEFSIFNTHVYPRQMYPALRHFIEETHGKSFSDFMSTRLGKCSSPTTLAKWTADKRGRLLSDFNLMGAFLWYHMPEAVYWMAADPYDLRPDQWRIDLIKYQWVCQANGRSLPADAAGKVQFREDLLTVTNVEQCNSVVQQWRKLSMKNPETRTAISRVG